MLIDGLKNFLREVGFKLADPNFVDTPRRIATMYTRIAGASNKEFADFTSFPKGEYDQMIMADNIPFSSWCAHHLLPFYGLAWVLYIPNEKVIGASKLGRMVSHYAERPQIQENLCHDILSCLNGGVDPIGAMVVIRATHTCISCRGAKLQGSGFTTSAISGAFEEEAVRAEAFDLIKLSIMMKGE